MENNPYRQFKRTLIDAWPNSKAFRVAAMVMIDLGIPWTRENGDLDMDATCRFVESFNMPSRSTEFPAVKGAWAFLMKDVPLYLATFYPKTSSMLFDGSSKDAAYACFLKEKKRPIQPDGERQARKKELRLQNSFIIIRARSLTKSSDWKTVK